MAALSLEEVQAQAAAILKTLDTSYVRSLAPSRYSRYHRAAAVLATFDPQTLQPAPGPDPTSDEDLAALLADSETLTVAGVERRTLPVPVRREILRELGTRTAMQQALAANPVQPEDPVQSMFAAYLRDDAPPLEEQSERQLTATYQCMQWLEGILDDLPTPAAVQAHWNFLDLLRPFNILAGTNFRGREAELGWLRAYVLDDGSLPQLAGALVIYGPGGVGKSALLARFILDNAGAPPEQRFPWTYIDFDRPGLNVAEPLTLIVEIVRQLAIQYPQQQEFIDRFRRSLQETQATRSQRRQDAQHGATTKAAIRRQPADTEWDRFFKNLASLLASLGVLERPLLLVLDTFEEVQFRSSNSVAALLRFLEAFQRMVPALRPVLAGRNPVGVRSHGQDNMVPAGTATTSVTRSLATTGFTVVNRELGDFQPEAAQALLVDRGMPPDLAQTIVAQVGGNPLSLRLALDLWRRGLTGTQGIAGLESAGLLEFQIQEGQIQGQLFARILEHLHDPEIQPLAHPGLILRRLTPDLILRVLARTCGVKVRDLDHAGRLLQRLAEEEAIVVMVENGVLIHRSDVRRIMVRLLRQKEPDKVRTIEQAAVRYYSKRASAAERAEEIYHRLTLNQRLSGIEKRWADAEKRGWIQEMRPLLTSAREELDPGQRAWLASKLDLELTPEESAQADQQSWEHAVEKRVRSDLEQGRAAEALAEMEQRPTWLPGSPLYLLATQACEQLGELDKARAFLTRGIRSAAQKGDRLLAVEMRLYGARLDSRVGEDATARRKLDEAEQLVQGGSGDSLRLLEIDLYRLLAARAAGDEAAQAVQVEAIVQQFAALSDARVGRDPAFSAWLAAEVGAIHTPLMQRVLRIVGLALPEPDEPHSDLTQRLVTALATWDYETSAAAGAAPGLLARAVGAEPQADETPSQIWRAYLYQLKPRDRGRRLAQLLQEHVPTPGSVLQALADLLRQRAGERDQWSVPASAPQAPQSTSPTSAPEPAAPALEVTVGDAEAAAGVAKSIDSAPGLTAGQLQQCTEALLDAFPTQQAFAELLRFRLDRNLETISFSNTARQSIAEVVRRADREGWILQLLDAARGARPSSAPLAALADAVGIGSLDMSQALPAEELNTLVPGLAGGSDVAVWRARLAQLENQVCRVELNGQSIGTGFLLGPAVVMTAYHVIADVIAGKVPPTAVLLRFDYKQAPDGLTLNEGTVFQLGKEWLVDAAPFSQADVVASLAGSITPAIVPTPDELGFALLRIADQAGYSGVGSDALESFAELRRWIDAPSTPVDLIPAMPMSILSYPQGGPLKLATAPQSLVDFNTNRTRLRYRLDTDAGSSGAPCFDQHWNLIALHLGRQGDLSFGTPIAAILEQLRAHGHAGLLSGYDL